MARKKTQQVDVVIKSGPKGTEIHLWRFVSLSGLLQNNPVQMILEDNEPEEMDDATTNGDGKAKKKKSTLAPKKKKYVDEEEAEKRVYRINGNFVHPGVSFRRAMASGVIGRKFGTVSARSVIMGGVFPVEQWLTILDKKGKPQKKYSIDKRVACVWSGKKRNLIPRVRPLFEEWAMDLALEIDLDVIELAQVEDVLDLAGRTIGIGDMRPDPTDGKSGIGTFGRFKAIYKGKV
jgi:hypothetical protein